MYYGGCNDTGCFGIKIRTDAAKLTNVRIARFRECRDLVREFEMFVKNEAKVTSRVSVLREELCILASCCLSPMRRNSVLQELRVSRLAVVQEEICFRTFVRPYERIKFGYRLENMRFLLLSTNLARQWLHIDTDVLLS